MNEERVLKTTRRPGASTTVVEVGTARFGDGAFPVIAGPCAVESEAQLMEAALGVAERGAAMLRGGAFKPRTSPYAFQGLGPEGLRLLQKAGRETGLPIVTEVMEPADVGLVADHAEMLQVGSRNMQNFALLQAVGESHHPVLLKRGASATVEEWLLAAEYILAAGNESVVLCERGIRTFETATRNTLDISAVPVVRRLSHLPVIIDPSHAAGARDLIAPLAVAAKAIGADGLIVEVHPRPDEAWSDAAQQLSLEGFGELMDAIGIAAARSSIDHIDSQIVRLLGMRLEAAVTIGDEKDRRGMPIRSTDREEQVLAAVGAAAARAKVDPGVVRGLYQEVLRHSAEAQLRADGAAAAG